MLSPALKTMILSMIVLESFCIRVNSAISHPDALIGTLALLFVLPAFFMVAQWLQEKIRPNKVKEEE